MTKLFNKRWIWPAIGLVAVLVVLIVAGNFLSFSSVLDFVQNYSRRMRDAAVQRYWVSVLLFLAGYVAATSFLPVAAVLNLLSGYLFGTVVAGLTCCTGTVMAGLVGFGMGRLLPMERVPLSRRRRVILFADEIQANGPGYLLAVRFFPVLPFSLINVLAGSVGVSVGVFTWTTLLGSIPAIFLMALAGDEFNKIDKLSDISTYWLLLPAFVVGATILARLIFRRRDSLLSNRKFWNPVFKAKGRYK